MKRIWMLLTILMGCASNEPATEIFETPRPIVIKNSRVTITRMVTRNKEAFKQSVNSEARHEH